MNGPAVEVREGGARYFVQREVPLIGSFELLATALQAVVKLRALITRLAVQGRLVRQEVGEVPIDLNALQRSAPAKLKSARPTLAFLDAIPRGWTLARLGDVFTLQYGSSLPATVRRAGQVPVYGSNGVVGHHSDALVFEPSLVIGRKGSVGAVSVAREPFWPIDTSYFVTPPKCVALEFSHLLFHSLDLGKHDKATAIPGINRNDVYAEPVLIPPRAEQHRIVARVEELMKLCDALEQSGRLADEQHARLTSTLFDALAASESADALAENWQRIAEHFDLLLDRPEAIDALEQTILQLAVGGLLVPQNARDEPASRLLGRLRAEQARLISIGQIRREKVIPALPDGDTPFELPTGWAWARLGGVANFIDYRGRTPVKTTSGVPLITAKNVRQGFINREPREYIATRAYDGWMTRGFPRCGDLLFTTEAPLGNVAAIDIAERFALAQRVICLGLYEIEMSGTISIFLQSPWMQEALAVQATGVTAQGIKSGRLQLMPIPVPPLAEQHRIVARVEELRLLCTQLRERLSDARRTQSQLADALVAAVGRSQ